MKQTIGRYEFLRVIGKGGMGEVILANDPVCERHVAIKRIRSDLEANKTMKNRFLREAKITAQLTHPGIISIFSIHTENEELYYTMPFVDGETLKQILRKNQKSSIAALLPIFRSLCQTIAYAHSKGIIHRDLKPENILVGEFGEVIVLDWGLAQNITDPPEEFEEEAAANLPLYNHSNLFAKSEPISKISASYSKDSSSNGEKGRSSFEESGLTRPGKLVGTVAYMAPERALGSAANIRTDIYALGVILYQILTLQLPFNRLSIKEFRKNHLREKIIEPEEAAPYRDVPPSLSRIAKKCLDKDLKIRYQNVDELIHDLMCYMEGRSEWFESARLNITRKKDWEFQENVLISKNIAITRTTESADWVSIMVSKAAFAENTRVHAKIRIKEKGAGLGLLLSVPENSERESPLEGYCLWLGSNETPFSQLFRNTVEVMHLPDLYLKKDVWHTLAIEKVDHNIHFYLDDQHRFTYLSYLPLFGTHVGLMARDADFDIEEIIVSIGSQNLQVSCLSIPDAFLASKDFNRALAEYRRIGYSFPGHAEGREALFRSGITLLEQARVAKSQKRSETFFTSALEEFAKLHNTPGAPLEYLGKALVYQSLRDHSEEIKCLELGLRRYFKHPLVGAIREQIIYRMHESAQTDRRSAYQLILISLRLLPDIVKASDSVRLFKHVIKHWEPLPFLENAIDSSLIGKEKSMALKFAASLAFWLSAPYILMELFNEIKKIRPLEISSLGDILFMLFELGSYGLAYTLMQETSGLKTTLSFEEGADLADMLALLKPIYLSHSQNLEEAVESFFSLDRKDIGIREFRTLSYLMVQALKINQEKIIELIAEKISQFPLSYEDRIALDALRVWAFLKEKDYKEAEKIFETYPLELLNQESTLLHTLYGCWLYGVEGEEISNIHFNGVIDTAFPRSWSLLAHELSNKITESPAWYSTSFSWERRRLYAQLALYFSILENHDMEAYYKHLEREEYIYVPE